MDGLNQYKRRNPFDEYGRGELISVYLRQDVINKAIEVWGSLETLEKEREKRRVEHERRRRQVFHLKKTLRDYQNRIEQLENPIGEKQYVISFRP